MTRRSRPAVIRHPFLNYFLLLALLLAGTGGLMALEWKAAASSAAPDISTANKSFTPAAVPLSAGHPVLAGPTTELATQARVRETYGKLPVSFEANQGQSDRSVKFLARGSGYSLFLTSTEAVLRLPIRIADR